MEIVLFNTTLEDENGHILEIFICYCELASNPKPKKELSVLPFYRYPERIST